MEFFELSPELIELIIFGMENQEEKQVFDTRSLVLCKKSSVPENDERYVDIPQWGPAQGYRLMETFVANLKNPLYKQELRDILVSGDRVFRRFKDAIKAHPFLERKWYWFKEKQLKREVMEWYNRLRELAGLESLPLEPDDVLDMSDLIEESFSFSDRKVDIVKEKAFLYEKLAESVGEDLRVVTKHLFYTMALYDDNIRHNMLECFLLEGDLAAFCWYYETDDFMCLNLIYVFSEFRDMGIGTLLVEKFCNMAEEKGKSYVIRLVGKGHPFSDKLKNMGMGKIEETVFPV
ncbi:UPF0158 family protein [Spirochaetia bacterium 38H-sp]|uniref:UPF0158 family protein n=1 Tax=Rarispira pelagica TaxID=3141764 RepID=A0ABU9UA72_9SPIR